MTTQQKKPHGLLLILVTTISCALLTGCPDEKTATIDDYANEAAKAFFSACKGDQSNFNTDAKTFCKNLTKP